MSSVPAPGAAIRAHQRRAVAAAVARFERESGMSSPEFVSRYLDGEFGRAAWARVWYAFVAD